MMALLADGPEHIMEKVRQAGTGSKINRNCSAQDWLICQISFGKTLSLHSDLRMPLECKPITPACLRMVSSPWKSLWIA